MKTIAAPSTIVTPPLGTPPLPTIDLTTEGVQAMPEPRALRLSDEDESMAAFWESARVTTPTIGDYDVAVWQLHQIQIRRDRLRAELAGMR